MTKLMYDSINPSAIPADAPVIAYYDDGLYRWSLADRARFPNAVQTSIVCFPQSAGDILDIEQGCASPADVPGWLDRYDRATRRVPTLYVNRSNWDAVRAAVGSRQVDYWVAIPGATSIPDGAVAVQNEYPGAYDVSLCRDWWPRMTPEEAAQLAYLFTQWNPGPTGGPKTLRDYFGDIYNRVGDIQNKVTALQAGGPVNLQPVLDAVAALKTDLDGLTLKKA